MKPCIVLLLIALSCSMHGQVYTSYYTGNVNDTLVPGLGGVCMMGGASEHDEAMKWFLRQCNGGDVLVLRASGSNGYNNYLYSQLGIEVNSVETIVCNSAQASYDPYVLQKISQAEGIWFAGGDQWDYVSYWRDTPVDSLINQGIAERQIVIGGTSAGMAILGGFYFSAKNGTVTSGAALANPYTSKVTVDSNSFIRTPYLSNVITDTHYDNPDRKGRQITFLARIYTDWGAEARGIACDEYTALCIGTDGIAHAYGDYPDNDDNAWFIQTNCELETRGPEKCINGSPLIWDQQQTALKAYNIKGTNTGANTFDLNTFGSGTGGDWYNWYVTNGVFNSSESDRLHCQPSALEDIKDESFPFVVFPNPYHSGPIVINYAGYGSASIDLMDMQGRKIDAVTNSGVNTTTLTPALMQPGVYILSVALDHKRYTRKIIVY
ncbi:MAG: T9SS type A sorting domain-containing protein [Saprospiraceae bacterium]|nr:T9SS type A sorting domain-containing protein [Candidatus Opimibacter iunctus]